MSLMNGVFKPFVDSFVIVFIDEILVYLKSKEEHADHLHIVLGVLGKQKLYAKFSKCEFWLTSVAFLEHVISREGVMVDPQKIEEVKNWVRPSFVTELTSFVGRATYYCRFVKNFASIATHLTRLTKNEVPFEWTEKCHESFQKLKTLLTTTPILALPVESKDFIVYCDAFHSGLGVVLMQDKNAIAYAPWRLKVYEMNYPTHDLELAAVVLALKIWRHYLYGVKCEMDGQSERTIEVLKDMLRACVIDFGGHWDKFLPLCEFSYNNSYHSSIDMAPFEALYGRGCRSPIGWFEEGDVKPLGVDLAKDAQDKVRSIQAKFFAAQSRHEKYTDHKNDKRPRYIGPFEILDYIGPVSYRLALPPNLSGVHLVFHVSMLNRYHGDGDYIIKWDLVLLDKDLPFEEEPVAIPDRDVQNLRTKEIKFVKVQWQHRPVEEATWEIEKDM
ncbi:hypothetical protein MTR67_052424 [Solanum verrucosum]|uniref:Uncharacterized protein n=1 Tax=Solanum verrucosum TaxID=315347 RepID=A0AAF0V8D5_SOLVR|nr:hypothetical protein MTR67_052424 [Solanum verrucosum]